MNSNTIDGIGKTITVAHIASGDLWAGAEVQLYHLARALDKIPNIKIRIILFNHGELERRLRDSGISVDVLDETRLNTPLLATKLIALLWRSRPDIVHTHRQKENILGSVASVLCRTKSVRTVHGAPEWSFRPWMIHKRIYSFLDHLCGRYLQQKIVAVSEQLARSLTQIFPAKTICAIENGIDLQEIIAQSTETIVLPGPEHRINIALVGRLVPVKRHDLFLKVARLATSIGSPSANFYIFGNGPLESEIRSKIEEYDLTSCMFMMGFKANMPAYMAHMDLLLITSDHEGLPMNLLEALCLRVPVIAHATGGIPAVLNDGEYGTLLDTQDPEGFVKTIQIYTQDASRFKKMADGGYQYLVTRYSIEHIASLYQQLYLRVVSNAP